ncbi:hypothetical protein Bmul_6077 [Burkholderia multivorans ATCC 17616]|nr:hypothetical protein Bmul_6077 [Burkholderia multivorans ATCC 17616]
MATIGRPCGFKDDCSCGRSRSRARMHDVARPMGVGRARYREIASAPPSRRETRRSDAPTAPRKSLPPSPLAHRIRAFTSRPIGHADAIALPPYEGRNRRARRVAKSRRKSEGGRLMR